MRSLASEYRKRANKPVQQMPRRWAQLTTFASDTDQVRVLRFAARAKACAITRACRTSLAWRLLVRPDAHRVRRQRRAPVRTPDTGAVPCLLTVAPVPEPDHRDPIRDDGTRPVETRCRPLRSERRSSRDAMVGCDRSRDGLPRPAQEEGLTSKSARHSTRSTTPTRCPRSSRPSSVASLSSTGIHPDKIQRGFACAHGGDTVKPSSTSICRTGV